MLDQVVDDVSDDGRGDPLAGVNAPVDPDRRGIRAAFAYPQHLAGRNRGYVLSLLMIFSTILRVEQGLGNRFCASDLFCIDFSDAYFLSGVRQCFKKLPMIFSVQERTKFHSETII